MKTSIPMPSPAGRLARTHALLVGVERYGLGTDAALDGPARAVCDLAEWLLARGAKPGNLLVHVSPKEENEDMVLKRLAALELTHREATESRIRDAIIQDLAKRDGDTLLVYWCGHGFVEGESERRLFCSDATQGDWRHIRFFDLLHYLRRSQVSFRYHVGFVDACAQYTAGLHLNELPDHRFPAPAEQAYGNRATTQYVVLSTGLGQFAKGADGSGAVPLFTQKLLDELKADALGEALGIEGMRALDGRLQQRFDELNTQKLADQLPSHYYARDWNGSPTSIGSPWPQRQKGLLSHGWVSQAEVDELAKTLPGDFLPTSLVARLYRDCVPANTKVPEETSLHGIIRQLIQLEEPQQDTVAPLFRFLRQLAYRIPTARDGLLAWLKRMEQARPELRVFDEDEAAQEKFERYYVSVVVGAEVVPLAPTADRAEEGRFASIRVWKGNDPRPSRIGWDPDEPVPLAEVRKHLSEVLLALEEELRTREDVTIEFWLPRVLLAEPVDEWQYPEQEFADPFDPPQPLGAAFPAVLRDTQRPKNRLEKRLRWQERWRRLSKEPRLSIERLPWLASQDELPLGQAGAPLAKRFFDHLPKIGIGGGEEQERDLPVCIGFCFDLAQDCLAGEGASLLYGAWQAGLPAALWFRQPGCQPAEVKARFEELFRGTLLHELPRRLFELRREESARSEDAAAQQGALAAPKLRISLVWDDPSRPLNHPSAAGATR